MATQLVKEHNFVTLTFALLLWPAKVVSVYFWLCLTQTVASVRKEFKELKSYDGWDR